MARAKPRELVASLARSRILSTAQPANQARLRDQIGENFLTAALLLTENLHPMRLLAATAFAILLALCPLAGAATTFAVNDTGDTPDAHPGDGVCDTGAGKCTLVAAMQEANALAGTDIIQLPPGTYVYTATLPTVSTVMTIEPTTGTDPSATVIQSSNSGHPRLFDVTAGGDLTLDTLTLENAQTGLGSALRVTSGSATLTNCVVTNNTATALYATSNSSLTISGCTISSNPGTTGPGGMSIDFSDVMVVNTTFSGNGDRWRGLHLHGER
jgi:parallel beta-helix repeat protein